MAETTPAKPETAGAPATHGHTHDPEAANKPKIHRVCISCNNMFEVTIDNYEAKHCAVCHKA
jgi:hypothetical protein